MDHNIDQSLHLGDSLGVEFENSDNTVHQPITLDSNDHGNMCMELEPIDQEQIVMETGNEEIIDFINDAYEMQDYEENPVPAVDAADLNIYPKPSVGIMNIPYKNITSILCKFDLKTEVPTLVKIADKLQTFSTYNLNQLQENPVSVGNSSMLTKVITLKAVHQPRQSVAKKNEGMIVSTMEKPVPIAPKPVSQKNAIYLPKQFYIAPRQRPGTKALSLVAHKKMLHQPLQTQTKGGQSILAQVGKHLLMLPNGKNQKYKIVTSNDKIPTLQSHQHSENEKIEVMSNKNQSKRVLTKLIIQGQGKKMVDPSNYQSAIITKIRHADGSTSSEASLAQQVPQKGTLTMHQKTVPIKIMTSPVKNVVKITKKQVVLANEMMSSAKSKLITTQGESNISTLKQSVTSSPIKQVMKILKKPNDLVVSSAKKMIITASTQPSMVMKSSSVVKTTPSIKEVSVVSKLGRDGKPMNSINIPGKSIQIIRLVNQVDHHNGKIITTPISGEGASKRYVKIAVKPKLSQAISHQLNRSSQSLLAPMNIKTEATEVDYVIPEMMEEATIEYQDAVPDMNSSDLQSADGEVEISHDDDGNENQVEYRQVQVDESDSKFALRTFLENTCAQINQSQPTRGNIETDVNEQTSEEQIMDEEDSNQRSQHPLIVIPNFDNQNNTTFEEGNTSRNQEEYYRLKQFDNSAYNQAPSPAESSEHEMFNADISGIRPRKACNCTKSQCLKLYCDCFANGEFCNNCNCVNCKNNLENEEWRQKAIRGCLNRNPNAFRPKIGKTATSGPDTMRRHNKGCNCKRSGCLKNYCECYEAKIACTAMCKCYGCRNVEDARRRDLARVCRETPADSSQDDIKQPCTFMTTEVIEAVCQCLVAAATDATDTSRDEDTEEQRDAMSNVIEEFGRCLQDIISASKQAQPLDLQQS